jgi:hypothetical protein
MGFVMPTQPVIVSAGTLQTTLPASVDLTPYAQPTGDQGEVGSCAAWATDYSAMGYWENREGISAGVYEPMYTYAQIAQGEDYGSSPEANLAIDESQGVDVQSDYSQGNFDYTDQPTAHERANAANWKLSAYADLSIKNSVSSTVTENSIKSALAAGNPVVIGIPVYQNFFAVSSKDDVYTTVSGALEGWHAIAVLGYNSVGARIENSWGSYWGASGFATLGWNFVNQYVADVVSVGYIVTTPGILTVSPLYTPAAGGATITVTGTAFNPTDVVSILTGSGQSATTTKASTTYVSPTELTFVAPAHADGSVTLTVSGTGGQAVTPFGYAEQPKVTSLSPSASPAAGGGTVTVTGSGFDTSDVVYVVTGSGKSAVTAKAASTYVSPTELTFVAPAHADGAVTLSVVGTGGSTSAGFTYAETPDITRVSPGYSPAAGGGTFTITGSGFDSSDVVTIASVGSATTGAKDKTTYVSTTQLTFVAPAHADGPVTLTVTGAGGATSASFAYADQPKVTSLSPSTSPAYGGGTVTITGSNFDTSDAVSVVTGSGQSATSAPAKTTYVSATQLKFVVPAHADGAVTVTVTGTAGTASASFTYAH